MRLKSYTEDSLVHLNFIYTTVDAATLPPISKPVSRIVTQQLNVA